MTKRRVARTRNNGTMTENMFWAWIRSVLRQKSRWWKPVSQCRVNARRSYKGKNKRQKWEYQCKKCENWFDIKKINVDHIIPVGTLKSAEDLPTFIERLFCEVDGLQVLCNECHDKKTIKDNKKTRKNVKM